MIETLLPRVVYGLSTASVFLYQPMTNIVSKVAKGISIRGNIIVNLVVWFLGQYNQE